MPSSKTSKKTKPAAKTAPIANKPEPSVDPSANHTEEKNSQFATILIGLLIIASGLLIYNYFQTTRDAQRITNNEQSHQSQTTPTPTPTPAFEEPKAGQGSYTVQTGDSLWVIAEKVYGDGFQWGKIAQANNLTKDKLGRPVVTAGQVLVTPDSAATTSSNSATVNKPTAGQMYTVQRGDNLWDIASTVYGDGSKWVAIFNDPQNHLGKLANGRPLIHAGNILHLPAAP